jgi:hypothetical protein
MEFKGRNHPDGMQFRETRGGSTSRSKASVSRYASISSRLPIPAGWAARSFWPASAASVGEASTAATGGTAAIGW